ncbi:MAG: TonB-dependent receptor domain-containing protein, partial [Acidimicrobiia bacterium]
MNRRNQFGGTVGFPIKRNLLFGFLSADRTDRSGSNFYTRDVFLPTELELPRLTRGNDTAENQGFIESVLKRFPSVLVPNDPRSIRTAMTQQPFSFPDRDYSGRLDWQPSSVHHLFGRWQRTRHPRNPQDVIIGEQARQNNRQQNLGITWTHVLSPTTVGELRYGLGLRKTRVDIAAGNDTPIIRFTPSPVAGSTIGNAGGFPIHRDQLDNQFVYNLSRIFSSTHSFKTGVDARRQHLDDLADDNSRGVWTFRAACSGRTYPSPWAAFMDGCVNEFTKTWGPFFLENRLSEYNVYAEDNWRLRPNLTLNLGVRYEYVAAPREAENRIDYVFGDDEDNIEPRLGFAYSPGWKTGSLAWMTGGPGNASIRGGYGLYHGRLFQSIFSQTGASVRTNPPHALRRNFSHSLNISDPTGGFVFVPGPQTARHSLVVPDPNLEMPYTHQWNLTLERKILFNSSVRLSYSGTRGIGFLKYTQDNLPVSPLDGGIVVVDHPNNAPAPGSPDLRGVRIDRTASDVLCAGTGFIPGVNPTAACPNPVPIADNEVSFRVRRNNERRPDPRYGTNSLVSNGAESWYHGLQAEWIKRLSRGLQFQMAYTWSKAIDTTSEATFVGAGDSNQNGPNAKFARGLSRFHTPHRLTFSGSYLLPLFSGRHDLPATLFGGWQLSGIVK